MSSIKRSALADRLLTSAREKGDGLIHAEELIGMAYGPHARKEYLARQEMILNIVRAKREAGFSPRSVFFRDVWPAVLAKARRCSLELMGLDGRHSCRFDLRVPVEVEIIGITFTVNARQCRCGQFKIRGF